jgi:hypothetical protein
MPPRRPSPLAPSQGSFPEATHVPRPPRSLPPPRAARRPANTRRTAGRSGVPPARHSRRGRRVLLGVRRQSLGQWHARGSPINEAVALPLARDLPAARLDARRRHGRRAGGAATSGRLHAKPRSPPPFPAPILAPQPPQVAGATPPRRHTGRSGHIRWAPLHTPPPTTSTPKSHPNRSISSLRPSPARAQPPPAGG